MLLSVREPFYTAASDICINTHGKQVNEIAQAIIHLLSAGDSPLASREYAVGFLKASGMEEAEWKNAQEVLIGDAYFPARRFYAVAGNPCMHSKSPLLFNSLFRQFGIPAFYTRFEHPDCGVIMQLARDLHMKGLSVTIPHKTSIMPFVDRIDGHSRKIGAVNTVVFCKDRAYGYNTDWTGIRDPVSDLHLDAARAVVIGAGGAAAAAVYALLDLQMEVIILSRTPGKGAELARRLGASHSPLPALESLAPDLVVNATPVGMSPDWRSPVPREVLKEGMTVFDLVYTPPETTLIRDARAAGCRTITGTEMFIRQACAQFRHFTGIEVPVGRIRELV
jgi:shikimate dehydrogenase